MDHLCRTCGLPIQEGKRHYIFDNGGIIAMKLKSLSVEVTQKGPLPKAICESCVHKLNYTHEFITQIRSAQLHFNNLGGCSMAIKVASDDRVDRNNKEQLVKLGSPFLGTQVITCQPNVQTKINHPLCPIGYIVKPVATPSPLVPTVYLCKYCSLTFPSHDAATEHVREVHKKGDGETNEKAVPSNSTETNNLNFRSERNRNFYACTSCYIAFPTSESLNLHLEHHDSLPACQVCGAKFTSPDILDKHMKRDEHTASLQDSDIWRCSECGRECKSKCKIQYHMRVHTNERPFKCNSCPKAFPIKNQLTLHERKHNNDWQYVCNYCGKGFYVKVYFDNHVRTAHTKEKPFKCDKCDAMYASKASLRDHIISKHNDGTLPVKIYECKSCGKKFKDNNSLYYHNKTHAATLEERRKHKCLVCNVSFVKNHYLTKHMRIHTGENYQRFECHLCGKKLATSRGLELHLVIHSGVKNFVCDFCGKAFASESTLKAHIRCHTGEKPYQCRVCSNFFTQRSSLLSHLKNIHNIDDRIRKIKFDHN